MTSGTGAACSGPDREETDVRATDAHADARPDVRPDVVTAMDVPVDHYVAPDVQVDVPHDTGAVCVASCTSDLSCQTTCPASTAGTHCCDTSTGICYVSASVCPSTTPDSGMMMYP